MHELEFLVAKHFGEIDRVWKCKVCGQIAYSRSWFVKYPKCVASTERKEDRTEQK